MIRSIVVGAGRIALSHLPHIIFHPKIDLVAIVEPNRVARFLFRRLTKIPVIDDISRLDDDLYDSAFVLTPPSTHFLIVSNLLRKKKNVFLEKPLSLNPNDSQQLLELAQKYQVQFSVGYVYRFHPIFRKLKSILSERVASEIMSAKINMLGNVVSKETPKTWRNTGVGSGCIYDYGCHVIDLSLYLFGRPSITNCLEKKELFQEGVVDKFIAELVYDKEFKLQVNCDWANSTVRKAGIEIEICTKNEVIWTDGQLLQIRGAKQENLTIKDLNTDVSYYLRGEEFQNQLDEFVKQANTKKLNFDGAEDASFCDEIISQIHECKL